MAKYFSQQLLSLNLLQYSDFLKRFQYACSYKGCSYKCNHVHSPASFYSILSRALFLTFVLFFLLRYEKIEDLYLGERLETTNKRLMEVRAERSKKAACTPSDAPIEILMICTYCREKCNKFLLI